MGAEGRGARVRGEDRGAAAVGVTSSFLRVTQQRNMNVMMRFITSYFSKKKKTASNCDVRTLKHMT